MAKINPYVNNSYTATYTGVASLAGVQTLLETANTLLTDVSGSVSQLRFKEGGSGALLVSSST